MHRAIDLPAIGFRAALLFCFASGCAAATGDPASGGPTATENDAAIDITGELLAGDTKIVDVAAKQAPFAAWIFRNDPTTDGKQLEQVTLPQPTVADGALTGKFAKVYNCLTEDGGEAYTLGGYAIGSYCIEQQSVLPNSSGSYLDIFPPESYADSNDKFSEVDMYYHVNQIHDYYSQNFGMTALDYPMAATVNYNVSIAEKYAKNFGVAVGWQGYPNAAFVPAEGFANLGLPQKKQGSLIFGQYQDIDFAYDASVIYHEYTHAMVGTTRLTGTIEDSFGIDNLFGAMNEGFADYFSCSLRENPIIGNYALDLGMSNFKRDLSVKRKCPDDLTTEIHADGKIIGSALWDMRVALGRDIADGIILNALHQFSKTTNINAAGNFIRAEAKKVSLATGKKVEQILNDHGILTCQRSKKWIKFKDLASPDKLPYRLLGRESLQGAKAMPDGVPGYLQFSTGVPSNTAAIRLSWRSVINWGYAKAESVAALATAVRRGQPPTIGLGLNGKEQQVQSNALITADVDGAKKGWQSMVIGGNCVALGTAIYVMFLNDHNADAAISEMDIEFLPSAPGKVDISSCQN